MDGSETFSDALEQSLERLSAAVDSLERAAERRMRQDDARANAEEEFALMQDDRSRLAVELDAALDRSRTLEAANVNAGERLAEAARTIGRIIERMDPARD
jgi:hypothetical protein